MRIETLHMLDPNGIIRKQIGTWTDYEDANWMKKDKNKQDRCDHKIDPTSIVWSRCETIVDFNCVKCGAGGSTRILDEDANWMEDED